MQNPRFCPAYREHFAPNLRRSRHKCNPINPVAPVTTIRCAASWFIPTKGQGILSVAWCEPALGACLIGFASRPCAINRSATLFTTVKSNPARSAICRRS